MKVLSLFDGMACWYEALQRAWIKIEQYYASEIDKYAIQIAKKNHPDIIEIWDVQKVWYSTHDYDNWWEYLIANWEIVWEWPIDLLIWGSPCQWFSVAGKMLNFNDPRSKLFFEYVRLLNEVKPKYFLLENVKMKKEWQDIISWYLWVQPIEINSSRVSAQNRKRLYRTNIPRVIQPQDKWILLKDILEGNVDEKYYYSEERWNRILANKYEITKRLESVNQKCNTLITNWWGNHERKIKVVFNVNPSGRGINGNVYMWDKSPTLTINKGEWQKILQLPRGRNKWWEFDEKAPTMSSSKWEHNNLLEQWMKIRKLTPIECERLQTLPDNYTAWVSDAQRYKMLGNWWTVDVIAHIFRFIP